MGERFDAVVIGSGIGGLTAALTMAMAGRSVLVLEAGKQFGGYLNPFARRHVHFDPGLHYVGELHEGGTLRRLFERMGMGDLEFAELDPDAFDRYVFPDFEIANCVGLDRFRDRLAEALPRERPALDRFFRVLKEFDAFVSKAGVLSKLRSVPRFARWFRATLGEMLDHYFDDPRAKAALAGPVGDLGAPPSKLSAIMHLGLLSHYARGAFFPRGGAGAIRDAYVRELEQHGATLERNQRVERILHRGGRAVGVQLADGRIVDAAIVISNAQAVLTYEMAGLSNFSQRLQRKVRRIEHSLASNIVFMAVSDKLETGHIGSSNIWNYESLDIDTCFGPEAMADHRKAGSYFLTVPTQKDASGRLAPEGVQTVETVALTGSETYARWFGTRTKRRGEDYETLKESIAQFYIDQAEAHLPGLREHLIFYEVSTPATNLTYSLAPFGNIYGPAHTPDQSFPFRFAVRSPVDGLFLCGASTRSAGIASCAYSGRQAGREALAFSEGRARARLPFARRPRDHGPAAN
ncbi:MAG: NAD(P)/FAD-dependent oxidoreductase [Myxococcota bacterium]